MANPSYVAKAAPKVLPCQGVCPPHEYQDAKYGKNYRLMNPTAKHSQSGSVSTYRCTVCGTERGV